MKYKFGDVVKWRDDEGDRDGPEPIGRFMVIAPPNDTVFMHVVCIKAAPNTGWEVDGDSTEVNSRHMEVCG